MSSSNSSSPMQPYVRSRVRRLTCRLRRLPAVVVTLGTIQLGAQSTPTFTAKDLLDVKEPALVALSKDGRWAAVITSWPRRHLGPTPQKYWGDPSRPYYFNPDPGEITVIDTKSGAVQRPLPGDRDVSAASWSPDGTRLALVARKGEEWQPLVWDRAGGTIAEVQLPAEGILAMGGSIGQPMWTPDGKELVFSLRTRAWQKEVQQRFNQLVSGDIVVMSSSEAFLPWEAQDREVGRYSVVAY